MPLYFSKLILENDITDPEYFYEKISHKLKILSIQSGDAGAFNNILSGIDCAIWDLFAKSKKIPLNKLFSQNSPNKIKVYASGINKSKNARHNIISKIHNIMSYDSISSKVNFNFF